MFVDVEELADGTEPTAEVVVVGAGPSGITVAIELGRSGVEKIVEYTLDAEEKAALDKSAAAVKESIGVMQGLVKF